MGPQVHAKFQRNRPSRYRETTGGTFVTSPQVARATCHSRHWHDSALVPYMAEGRGLPHQRRPLVNRAYGSIDISLSKAWPRPAVHTQIFSVCIPVRRHVWRCTSEPERDKYVFGVVSISRLSCFRDNETGDARANVQSPQLRLL